MIIAEQENLLIDMEKITLKLKKIKVRKSESRVVNIIIPKDVYRRLPDFFYADVTLENIEKREKER